MAAGHESLGRDTPWMSACTTTVLRLIGIPRTRDAAVGDDDVEDEDHPVGPQGVDEPESRHRSSHTTGTLRSIPEARLLSPRP